MTSLLFHMLNTLLLFAVLGETTGAPWRSAFVAALFALHPLHVESVAWISERKDVLSTFLGLLTMWTYVRYVRHSKSRYYFLGLVCFALGLLAKPMLVTLPFVLLLMDYWPLGRLKFEGHEAKAQGSKHASTRSMVFHLFREKLPLFALALGASLATFLVQRAEGSMEALASIPLKIRLANALVSYVTYMGKMIWPSGLAVFYPYHDVVPLWQAAGAGILVISITAVAVWLSRRFPYLPVGWFWYVGTLVPVIGIVQVGEQSMADRYTYIPLIGLFIIFAWGLNDLLSAFRYRRLVAVAASTVVVALAVTTWLQTRHWSDSVALFEHTLRVTRDNYVAHINLGSAMAGDGRYEDAIGHISKALQIKPDYADGHYNMGVVLAYQGKYSQAVSHFLKAIEIKPRFADAHVNLGVTRARQGDLVGAIGDYTKALQIQPVSAQTHNNMGVALARLGRTQEAIKHFSEALRIAPGYGGAQKNLRISLKKLQAGRAAVTPPATP
jgi:tetratricopeptide (TPR) repeat protein